MLCVVISILKILYKVFTYVLPYFLALATLKGKTKN